MAGSILLAAVPVLPSFAQPSPTSTPNSTSQPSPPAVQTVPVQEEPFPPVPNPSLPLPPNPLEPLTNPTGPEEPIPQPGVSPATRTTPPPALRAPSPLTPVAPAKPGLPPLNPNQVDLKALWGVFLPDTRIIQARGNVVMRYQNVILTADELVANLKTRDVDLRGHVVIQGEGRTVRGEALTYNLRTKMWKLGGGEAAFLPPRLLSPLFVSGVEVSGSQNLIEGGPGSFTTCDLPFPHYHIEGRHITIVPDKRAVIKGASFFWGRHKLFTLSRLVIPLQPNQYNIVPEVGQNNLEGYYVKTAYHYATGKGEIGTARVDLMSKRGVGLGVDQGYKNDGGLGRITLYSIVAGASALSGKELSGSLKHTQKIGTVVANLQSDFRSNSYLYDPSTRSLNNLLGLTRATSHASTTLNLRSNKTSGAFGTNQQDGYSLIQTQRWGKTFAQAQIDLFDSRSTNLVDQELNTQFQVTRTLPSYDIGLNYNKRDLLKSTNASFFSSLDRLPEVTFTTNRRRIKGGLFSYLPGSFGLSVGEFHEDPGDVTRSRVLLDLGLDNHTYKLGKTRLDVSGGFKQIVYSQDAAQYSVNSNVSYRIPFSKHDQLAWRYIYFGQDGYTPFRFDLLGKYHLITSDFIHQEHDFQFSVGSGRDLRGGQFAWNDVRLRVKYLPSDRLQISASSAYDLNNGYWRDVVNSTRIKFGQGLLNLGIRYTPTTGQVGTVKWNLFTPLGRKWSMQTFGGWNGFAKRYDYRVLRLNWEHHDFQASLSYVEEIGYRTDKGFRFMIHLRALPFVEQTAVGQFGQSLDNTDVGDVF